MADKNEAVQKALEEAKARREETEQQYNERMAGKPTPTQEENDRAKLGEHVNEKEDDGSPKEEDLEKRRQERRTRAVEAKPSTGYTTRASRPSSSGSSS